MIINKNWEKTPSQKRDSPKSSLLVLIIPKYKGLITAHKQVPLCNPLGVLTVITCPHHFLWRPWGFKDISDLLQMLQIACACTRDTVRLKKIRPTSLRSCCFGHDHNDQLDSKHSQNQAHRKVSERIKGLTKNYNRKKIMRQYKISIPKSQWITKNSE